MSDVNSDIDTLERRARVTGGLFEVDALRLVSLARAAVARAEKAESVANELANQSFEARHADYTVTKNSAGAKP